MTGRAKSRWATSMMTEEEMVPTAKLFGDRIEVSCRIQGLPTKVSWDTGAQVSLTCEAWLRTHLRPGSYTIHSAEEIVKQGLTLTAAGGGKIAYSGYTELSVRLGKSDRAREVIVPFLVTESEYDIPLLGSNTMDVLLEGDTWGAKLKRLASFGLEEPEVLVLTGMLNRWMEDAVVASVTANDEEMVPARTSKVINCRINTTTVGEGTLVLFQPNTQWEAENKTLTLYTAVLNLKEGINESVEIKVRNKNNHDFHFREGDLLGSLEEVQIIDDSAVQYKAPDNMARVQQISRQTTPFEIGVPPDHGLVSPHTDLDVGSKGPVQIGSKPDHCQPQTCTSKDDKPFAELETKNVPEANRPFYDQLVQMSFPELTADETAQAKQMLWEEKGAFSQNPDDIGSVPELQLQLNTIDEIPVQRNYNAIPKPMYAEVRAQIQTMLDKGWIRRSDSAWSSPIVLVKKKTGGMRLCCDFRLLNKKSVPDKHPIPRIAEALDTLQGSCIFSVLDLSRAYYQGYMAPSSCAKTAFVTPWGFYEWVRIPFGLSNAVPTFQRFMEKLLEDYRDHFALPYLDDTIVHGKSVSEHIEQIRKVLRKFQEKGLKLNPSKCELFKREVGYLGRVVNEEGYRMDEDSVKAVKELANKTFQTVGQVRKLMGLMSYHRRYVQSFAEIAKPLNELLADQTKPEEGKKTTTSKSSKKGVPSNTPIVWGPEHQAALEKLIGFITSPPILAYADYNSEFFLHTDASGEGLGAILYQEQQGVTRVIAYASRSLKPAERNYHSTKLEFMAMKWAICDQFRDYLSYADHFKVYTDNNPLLFVMGLTKPNSSIHRWISELGEFNFTVFFRPGKVNRDADSLSRLPLDMEAYVSLCEEETSLDRFQMMVGRVLQEPKESPFSLIGSKPDHDSAHVQPISPFSLIGSRPDHDSAHVQPGSPFSIIDPMGTGTARPSFVFAATIGNTNTIGNLKRDQEEDEYIGPTISVLRGNQPVAEPPSAPESTLTPQKLLLRERSNLFFDKDQILRRRGAGSCEQIVLPLKHREMILKALHTDMGHLGAERVTQLARQRVYWPRMQADIKEFTQKRCRCNAQRKIRQEAVAPLTSIYSSMPMEIVAIDFLHLETSSTGCEYILLLVDHFTRYAQAYPTKNKSALTAAKNLFNDFVLRFGLPARILHDQGREFDNRLFHELERFCGIVRSRTTPYHPQSNGTCERMNSTLLHMLRTLSESEKPNWHQHVNKLIAAYNATTHSSTGYSPYFLLFGREPLLPLDVILSSHLGSTQGVHSYNHFVAEWEARMTEAYDIARKNVQKVKDYSEERWKGRLTAAALQPGDKVLVRNKREQGGPGKLRSYWEQDIYIVNKVQPSGVVYEVQKVQGGEKRVLHRNMLLPCDLIELDDNTTPPQRVHIPPAAPVTRSRTTRRQRAAVHNAGDDGSDSDDEEFQYQFLADRPTLQPPDDPQRESNIEINKTQETATSPQEMGTNAVSEPDHVEEEFNPSDQENDEGASDQFEQVLPHDEASNPQGDASDPGEGLRNQVAGRSEDSTTTPSGLRWSDRRSRPPMRLSYNELGNPVANDSVPEQGMASDAHVNVSAVYAGQAEQEQQGWWNWIQDALGDLSIRLH